MELFVQRHLSFVTLVVLCFSCFWTISFREYATWHGANGLKMFEAHTNCWPRMALQYFEMIMVAMEKNNTSPWFTSQELWFSIAVSNHQRVLDYNSLQNWPVFQISQQASPGRESKKTIEKMFRTKQKHHTFLHISVLIISGWWLGHPSEKYESQLGWLFPIYGKIKNGNQTTNQIWCSNQKHNTFDSALSFSGSAANLGDATNMLWAVSGDWNDSIA